MTINPDDLSPGPAPGHERGENPLRKANRQMNILAKWRSHLAGWQLGTRAKGDPESDAVRDHREATLILRAEVTALVGLLSDRGIFTLEEFTIRVGEEAEYLSERLSERWDGARATEDGMTYEAAKLPIMMKGWRP